MPNKETLQKKNIGQTCLFLLYLTMSSNWIEVVNKERKIKTRLIRNFENLRG
jgi:hypothetical protein